MRIGHGVDTGAYCAQASCAVPGKTADELTAELAELGGDLLVRTLPSLADGTAEWTEQDESLVTHAAKIAKAEMRLDPGADALANVRRVMASSDAAPARCVVAGRPACVMVGPDLRRRRAQSGGGVARHHLGSRVPWLRGRRVRAHLDQTGRQARDGCQVLGGRPTRRSGHLGALSRTNLSPGRLTALRILISAREAGRYARELAADASAALDQRDAAFARRLALGVTSCSGCLDDALDHVLDDPRALSADVRDALRIGAYELLYLGTSPQVAVSQGVELARVCAHGAAGLANAVLRRVAEGADAFLAAD